MSSDPRFARIKSDPRFRRPKTQQHKVVVDDRFKSLFEDAKAEGKSKGPKVDKYGRKVSRKQEKTALKNFYRLEDHEKDVADNNAEAGPSEPQRKKGPDYARGEVLMESSDDDEDAELEVDSENDDGVVTLGAETYRLKDKAKTSSKSAPPHRHHHNDSDGEVNLDESEFADLDAQAAAAMNGGGDDGQGFGEQKRTTLKGHETSRLAVVNLDWDYIKATQLFAVFASTAALMGDPETQIKYRRGHTATDGGGKVLKVRVYPSEYGKSRLAREDVDGPPKEIFADPKQAKKKGAALLTSHGQAYDSSSDNDDLDVDDINEKTIFHQGDAEEYNQDELRRYQLERLRYYYAIVECDSPATAAYLYQELDATELERTANLLDLSFVPDDLTFDEEFRDEATQDLGNFKPLDFSTDALRHSKVKLTWDDDDQDRVTFTRRHLTAEQIEDNDFRAYLASSGESDEDGEGATDSQAAAKAAERQRLRALLLGDANGGGDDEFFVNDDTMPEGWGGSGKNKAGDLEITFTPGLTEGADGTNGADEENITTIDRYKKKIQEKKQARTTKWEKNKEAREKAEAAAEPAIARDDFFEADSEEGLRPASGNTKGKSIFENFEPTIEVRRPSTKDELALLAADVHVSGNEPKHFDMSKVIKAEKDKTKKKLRKKKGKGAGEAEDEEGAEREDGEGFEINVNDERFKALHEQHEFAIDPSNPHFKKTKSMNSLLEERRKRYKQKVKGEVQRRVLQVQSVKGGDDADLKRLVESVKRKTGGTDRRLGSSKRRRV
ncbi:pre-rRNA-processing protein esf1 [Tulasnella sp. JGI-2019a]|nr:pre-rRNA-processing protein esf1 [Tulasnella sp. JGI-2019a]KAG9017852.1 pre-rRNA-processing protein esf1 [Tulasnella sp. JGI-2019a]